MTPSNRVRRVEVQVPQLHAANASDATAERQASHDVLLEGIAVGELFEQREYRWRKGGKLKKSGES